MLMKFRYELLTGQEAEAIAESNRVISNVTACFGMCAGIILAQVILLALLLLWGLLGG
ncbi:MAG: hypothetical protein KF774_07555 [Planctomyces sp.]|nr:hypothetical protein [Planctomyces sp.]